MAVHELLSDVSSNHSAFLLRCFHDDHDMPGASDRGREAITVFPTAPKCLLSHPCFLFVSGSGARTAVMTIAVSRPQFVYPVTPQFHLRLSKIFLFFLNGGKFRARV